MKSVECRGVQDPFRNLPLAIAIGIPLTTLCYVLVNVAYLAVLTPQQIIETDAVGSAWAQQVLGPAAFLIPLGVCMSVFGTANGSVFTAGRSANLSFHFQSIFQGPQQFHWRIRRLCSKKTIYLLKF